MNTPNRGTVHARMIVWDVATLQYLPWDGTLNTESVTIGAVVNAGAGKTLKTAVIDRATTGTIISAVGGRRIKVYSLRFLVTADLTVALRSGSSTLLEGAQDFAARTGVAESVDPPAILYQTALGESLDVVITGTGSVRGVLRYWDDDSV